MVEFKKDDHVWLQWSREGGPSETGVIENYEDQVYFVRLDNRLSDNPSGIVKVLDFEIVGLVGG